jgi:CRP-like cAMP-binding protein
MPLTELTETVTQLPRGGFLVTTSIGYIQFGIPPESIKDTMLLPAGIPLIYVLPAEYFNWIKGISIAELEFPIYYNYFIRHKKTRIVCFPGEVSKFKKVLQESLFGPEVLDFSGDFAPGPDLGEDIKREIKHFRVMDFDDVMEFHTYRDGRYDIDGVSIQIDSTGNFELYEKGRYIAYVPGMIDYTPKYIVGERLSAPFRPPLYGITCLGPSHGFDPHENTSGILIWMNHHGIMVDPPVNSTEWLLDSNVSPKLIDTIILTHCHADHDAGTFQKILEEGKVSIYTTRTVMMSFLRKYSALTDSAPEYLLSLFEFRPVEVGRPVFIHGGRFMFFYTLHSIPTIGFRQEFQEKSITYSSDHNNDPTLHVQLLQKGVIGKERYRELKAFPWESTIVFHESGYRPLHTPVEFLGALPDDIKKKTLVYHISSEHIPASSGLTRASFGIEKTIYFDVAPPAYESAYVMLGLLKYLDFLHDTPIHKAQEFISIVEEEHFNKGDIIIRKDTIGDKFYIIYTGNVSISSEDGRFKKIFGPFDYFGEAALITGERRSANVHAETDVTAFSITKEKFLSFIAGTDYELTLSHLVEIRDMEAWEILSTSRFMKFFTSTQRSWLETMLSSAEFTKPGTLIREGAPVDRVYIIRSGNVIVKRGEETVAVLQKGDIIGSSLDIYRNSASTYTFLHESPILLYEIDSAKFSAFLKRNPGLIMKLHYIFSQYIFFKERE